MRIYSYSLQTFGSRRIFIGKQGENAATRIDIDVTPWRTGYPDSVIALYVKPPSGNGYLAALGDDGKTVRWTVLDTDTAYAGIGSAELVLQNAEGTVIKSVTADTSCLESPSSEEPSEPPEAIRPWVEQILDAIANAGVGGGEGSGGGAPGVGGITEETDPTVPAWAKQPSKPTYTAGEVGARPDTWMPSASDVGADAAGTAAAQVGAHNVSGEAHADMRALIEGLTSRLNALADSDDETLDQLSEIVAYIKSNKALIDAVTTGKVSTSDIVDNLTTNASGKVLSAAQGVALKRMIDAIVIPDKLPNPHPLTINGQSYDGSAKVEVTVTGEGGGANINDTTPSSTTTYSSQKIESELNALNEANATQDAEIAKKANDSDLAKVAKSGSYTDLTNKPTIPTVPTMLPNPNALTFTGAVNETYDGSAAKSVAIPTVPESLKNPNKLILSGAVTAEYDGSAPVSVEIPSGGGGGSIPFDNMEFIFEQTFTEEAQYFFREFDYSKYLAVLVYVTTPGSSNHRITLRNDTDYAVTGSGANKGNLFIVPFSKRRAFLTWGINYGSFTGSDVGLKGGIIQTNRDFQGLKIYKDNKWNANDSVVAYGVLR